LSPRTSAPPVLVVESLAQTGAFDAVRFEVAAGECVGLYGFVGAGHQELAHALAGASSPTSGRVLVDGLPLPASDVSAAVERGVVLVAADRTLSLVRGAEVYKNVTLAHLRRCAGEWLTSAAEIRATGPVLERVGCQPANPRLRAGYLSGGNQQKVAIGRWLLAAPKVLILDEPTRGVDIGARAEIHRLIRELAAKGMAVLVVSSEPDELPDLCDRVLVMAEGRIVRELAGEAVTRHAIVAASYAHADEPTQETLA
jgi:ABC-type sugar transport system ATPase subunit